MGAGRVQVTPEQVVQSLLDKLRTDLMLGERQAWATVDPMVPISAIPPGGDEWVTLAMGDMRFALDDLGHDEHFLLDADRGAWRLLRKIIKAIHGVELLDENYDPWCMNLPQCTFASKPDYNQEYLIGWVQARFAIAYDWGFGDV
jgi:hypothetical protein